MHETVWNRCLKIIKDNVPSISYRTWFEPIVPLKLEKNILTIQVPSPFFYEYLEEQYIDILRKVLRKELGFDAKLEYSVVMENNGYSSTKPYTVKLPARNQKELKNKPVSVPIDSEGTTIKNPFIIVFIFFFQNLNSNYLTYNFLPFNFYNNFNYMSSTDFSSPIF